MSISIYSPSSSLRERGLHANVERQGLALGAARERTRCAASLSRERERRLEAAIDDWENEGGAVAGVHPGIKAQPSTKAQQSCSDTRFWRRAD